MKIADTWYGGVRLVRSSVLFHNVASVLIVLTLVVCALVLMFCMTVLAGYIWRGNHFLHSLSVVLLYSLTMCGVIMLALLGILGLFLPLIPGIPLLLGALLLLRKYHRWEWLEEKIAEWKKGLRRLRTSGKN
jgi:hypothetical protein